MTEHKLVIALPDECDLDATDSTITMTVEQAREWALSILDVTPPGTTLREQVEKRVRETEQMTRDLDRFSPRARRHAGDMGYETGARPTTCG